MMMMMMRTTTMMKCVYADYGDDDEDGDDDANTDTDTYAYSIHGIPCGVARDVCMISTYVQRA